MSIDQVALRNLLERHNFDCAVISSSDGQSLLRIGRYEDDECIAALSRDFFDPSTVKALGLSLVGKIHPQMSARGQCWALSGLTPLGDIIAIYGRSPSDVRLQYFKSKDVWRELETVWSK